MTETLSVRSLSAVALAVVIIASATANVLLKIAAQPANRHGALFGMINLQFILGTACFGIGLLAYAWALRHIPLHVAQIALSLQYVLAILLAGWILHEHIGPLQWTGIALITAGLYLCTR